MNKTFKIIACIEELIREDIRKVLKNKEVKEEDIDNIIRSEEGLFDNYADLVACFMMSMTQFEGSEILEGIKKEYPLDENTKKKVVLGIMDWVTHNNLLQALIDVYLKLEKDLKQVKPIFTSEDLYFYIENINDRLLDFGYFTKIVYGEDVIFGIENLVVIVEIIERFGAWNEIKNMIIKYSLLKKEKPFEGYLEKISMNELLALFSVFIEEDEYRDEICKMLEIYS